MRRRKMEGYKKEKIMVERNGKNGGRDQERCERMKKVRGKRETRERREMKTRMDMGGGELEELKVKDCERRNETKGDMAEEEETKGGRNRNDEGVDGKCI